MEGRFPSRQDMMSPKNDVAEKSGERKLRRGSRFPIQSLDVPKTTPRSGLEGRVPRSKGNDRGKPRRSLHAIQGAVSTPRGTDRDAGFAFGVPGGCGRRRNRRELLTRRDDRRYWRGRQRVTLLAARATARSRRRMLHRYHRRRFLRSLMLDLVSRVADHDIVTATSMCSRRGAANHDRKQQHRNRHDQTTKRRCMDKRS
jgi:hypothetical protein